MTDTATLTWYGHSNMQLAGNRVSVLIDPFFAGNPFAPDWKTIPRPDVIAVTHDHGDHLGQAADIARATGATVACLVEVADVLMEQGVDPARIVSWNVDGTVDIKGARLTMTQAFHSATHGVPVGFVIELPGGPTVYHAGDTGLFGDMRLIGERFSLDVALLPVGGYYTMDGVQAAKACALLRAKAAVPMHYGTFGVLAPTPDAFLEALKRHAPACKAWLPPKGEPCPLSARGEN